MSMVGGWQVGTICGLAKGRFLFVYGRLRIFSIHHVGDIMAFVFGFWICYVVVTLYM